MRIAPLLFGAAGLVAMTANVQRAEAKSLDACGDIFFEGSASVECTLEVDPGACKAKCTPLAFEAECAAEGYISCDGGCTATAEVNCTTSCQGSCEAECNGGEFDCEAYCEGNCSADCSGRCSSSSNQTECQASCKATCQGECKAGCNVQAPECQAQCQGCCSGECTAEANLDCQISCQSELYVECKAELQGGCEVQCEAPEGALFCNGQFVNASNVESCADAIIAAFDIEIEGYASAECEGNRCSAEAGASCACAQAPGAPGFGWIVGLGLAGATAGLSVARRLRRRK